jgi:ribosomal protein S18 acetylase RimI-like enzyme
MDVEIATGSAADLDDLETLWLQMLAYHRSLIAGSVPTWSDEQSWERARRDYRDWLADEAALLLLARRQTTAELVGYVVCQLLPAGATFDLGERRGHVDSLVVDDQARGHGVGTALLESVRAILIDRGIGHWSIGLLAQNSEAAKLYERVGFRPWTQELLASTRTQ